MSKSEKRRRLFERVSVWLFNELLKILRNPAVREELLELLQKYNYKEAETKIWEKLQEIVKKVLENLNVPLSGWISSNLTKELDKAIDFPEPGELYDRLLGLLDDEERALLFKLEGEAKGKIILAIEGMEYDLDKAWSRMNEMKSFLQSSEESQHIFINQHPDFIGQINDWMNVQQEVNYFKQQNVEKFDLLDQELDKIKSKANMTDAQELIDNFNEKLDKITGDVKTTFSDTDLRNKMHSIFDKELEIERENRMELIIWLSAGGFVLLLLVVVAVWIIRRKRAKKAIGGHHSLPRGSGVSHRIYR